MGVTAICFEICIFSLLWLNELSTNEKYESMLHKYFINASNDKVLLELEECSSDIRKTNAILENYWDSAHMILDDDVLGDHLFTELAAIYKYNKFGIEEFGKRCYSLWNHLPSHLQRKEPFWTLSYADDCLSWNDEAQTRKLYEEAFSFYRQKK